MLIAKRSLINDFGKVIGPVFLFFCFFPYIVTVPTLSDTQPNALILACLTILLLKVYKAPKEVWILCIPFVGAVGVGFASGFDMTALRSVTGYASMFLITLAGYTVFRMNGGISQKTLDRVILIWLLFGTIQMFLWPEFGKFLVRQSRTSLTRGATSLAAEPSYYGIVCLFLLMFCYLKGLRTKSVLLLIVQVVLISRSAMTILILLLFVFYYVVFNSKNILRIVMYSLLAIGALFMVLTLLERYLPSIQSVRAVYLLWRLSTHPGRIVLLDESGNDRLLHIFFSFLGAMRNGLIPHGFSAWEGFVKRMTLEFSPYVYNVVSTGRIMSTYGSVLFELGFLGLAIPYVINRSLIKMLKKDKRKLLTILFCLNSLLLTAVPLAFPYLGLLVGYAVYKGNEPEAALEGVSEPGRRARLANWSELRT